MDKGRIKRMNTKYRIDENDFKQKITITSFLMEYTLDDGSEGIMLLTEDGDDIYVIPNGMEKKLWHHIDKELVVTGFVTTDELGDTYISVRGFETMEYDEDDYDDDQFDYDDNQFDYDW